MFKKEEPLGLNETEHDHRRGFKAFKIKAPACLFIYLFSYEFIILSGRDAWKVIIDASQHGAYAGWELVFVTVCD